MARPRKSLEELRLHQINIRLTDLEKNIVEEAANSTGLSVADWLRSCAFSGRRPTPKPKLINRELYIELSRIGNNLNQLTKHINTTREIPPDLANSIGMLKQLLSKIQNQIIKL